MILTPLLLSKLGLPNISKIKSSYGDNSSGSTVNNTTENLFEYDFINLFIKLFIFFTISIIFSKFMELVIGITGPFNSFLNLIGINTPQASNLPPWLVSFYTTGWNGLQFWDVVKVVAILLVLMEFNRYITQNRKLGSTSSPMTIGIFVVLFGILTLTTIPELYKRIKNHDMTSNIVSNTTSVI